MSVPGSIAHYCVGCRTVTDQAHVCLNGVCALIDLQPVLENMKLAGYSADYEEYPELQVFIAQGQA